MSDIANNESIQITLSLLALVLSPILLLLTWIWARLSGNNRSLNGVKMLLSRFVTKKEIIRREDKFKSDIYQRMDDVILPVKESNIRIESNMVRIHERFDELLLKLNNEDNANDSQ